MSRKDRNTVNDKSLTVSEYSRQFFERTVSNAYGKDAEENQQLAGQNFLNLIRKLQEAGSKDDIKVPLRVLRDEIGRIYFGSAKQRNERIETLFKLYDAVEAGSQEDLRSKEPKQVVAATQVLEELRQRFSRLVIGDTWEAWPELKLIALKRMHNYAVHENQLAKESNLASPPPTPSSGRLGMRKLSRSFSGVTAGSSGTSSWQAAIDDLAKAPGSRLLPIIKLLLIEHTDLPEDTKEGLTADAANAVAKGGRISNDGLWTQPSGVSETAEVGRRVADLNMDDLLGLNDPIEEEAVPNEDPFKVRAGAASADHPIKSDNLGRTVDSQPELDPKGGIHSVAGNDAGSNSLPSHQHISSAFSQPGPAELFEKNAFSPQSLAPHQQGASFGRAGPGLGVNTVQRSESLGTANSQPGGFNPFGLPSPSYATPVPAYVDNSFADFSPVAGAPAPPVPQPMRAPPQPPVNAASKSQTTAPQAPTSTFKNW